MVKNLRKLRAYKGISQQQLAEIIGTTQQSVNKYENHSVEPDIRALIQIADYFGTTVDYLIGHDVSGRAPVEELVLDRDEITLIENYRRLSSDEKQSLRLVVRNYLKYKTPPED